MTSHYANRSHFPLSAKPPSTTMLALPTIPTSHPPPESMSKIFNDPIHGYITLPPQILRILDTPHLQRLRDLKQLGATYHVFPGACHNRFEHSLGVAHLSADFLQNLHAQVRRPSPTGLFDGASRYEECKQLVQIAGLVHDIGHGPFSHSFDHAFVPAACRRRGLVVGDWGRHEVRSVRMFEHLVEEFHIDLSRDSIRAVGDLVHGKATGHSLPTFLYDIVANSSTGIDTDKFDYLARDIYNIGLQSCYGFDHSRLMNFAKVINGSVCFHRKEIFNVYHLFLTRFQLHRIVYNHPTTLAIDAMITDVLLEADHIFKIFETVNDPASFLHTTDSVLYLIERSTQPALRKARDILARLRTRRLYKLADEALLPPGYVTKITEDDIINAASASLTKEQIHVANVTLNFGMRDQNPVDNVPFFNDWDDPEPVKIPSTKVSYVLPPHFEERIVRVFVKSEDADTRKRVSTAFRQLLKLRNIEHATKQPFVNAETEAEVANGEVAECVQFRAAKRVRPNGFAAH